ncbi:SDR family oxidoreductase [Nocardia callitridis]|uniref:Uncharacterized protein n=1 Tax=Nocardia callitridis TaxID=648753 RepID=A0ABP9KA98_9NOCA
MWEPRWIASARTLFERAEIHTRTGFYEACAVAVTGAGSGIGRELARESSRRGSFLALADVDMAKVRETQGLCSTSDDVEVFQVDARDRDAVAAFAAGTVDRFGRCDVLIANAGVLHIGAVESTEYSEFDSVLAVNFGGVVNSVKAFLPHLRVTGRPARIVTVSSAGALSGCLSMLPTAQASSQSEGSREPARRARRDEHRGDRCVSRGRPDTNCAVRAVRTLPTPDVSVCRVHCSVNPAATL